jgi:hypothetical protein
MFLILLVGCSLFTSVPTEPEPTTPTPSPDVVVETAKYYLWPSFQIKNISVEQECTTGADDCVTTSCTVRNTYQKPNRKGQPTEGKVTLKYSDRKKIYKKTMKVTMPFDDTVELNSEFSTASIAKDGMLLGGCLIQHTGAVGSCIITNSGGDGDVTLEFSITDVSGSTSIATVTTFIKEMETKEITHDFDITTVVDFSCVEL